MKFERPDRLLFQTTLAKSRHRDFFFEHEPVFRAFHKFVVKLNGILAVEFVMGAGVLFSILVVPLFDDRRAIRQGEAN